MARLRRRVKSPDVKWVPPANLHVTLQFIGYADDERSARVRDVLAAPLDIQPFDIRVAGIGAFPSRGGPRVIWCGVEERTGRLLQVQREIERRLVSAVGIEPESRPYHPHLTLARYRTPGRVAERRAIEQHAAGELGTCEIDRVTLYESKLSPRGPTYSALLHAPLSGTIHRSVP